MTTSDKEMSRVVPPVRTTESTVADRISSKVVDTGEEGKAVRDASGHKVRESVVRF